MKDSGGEALADAVAAGIAVDASAESVAQARRLVAAQLDAWGLAELSDDARLVISELLTNAALHARPPIRMKLARIPAGIRMEVSDGSAEVPLQMRPAADVMTGRGWTLVEALCREWGVDPEESGKVVWVTMTTEGPAHMNDRDEAGSASVDTELLELFDFSDASSEPHYAVALGDVPTELLVAAKAHIDALIREFALVTSGAADGASPIPPHLAALIQQVTGNFREARQSIKKQALRASQAGLPRTQLVLDLPASAAQAGLAYLEALDQVDAYCRAERMLTLESPPAHRLFRRWYVEELVAGLLRATDPNRDPMNKEADHLAETFESRLLREYERLSTALRERESEPAEPT